MTVRQRDYVRGEKVGVVDLSKLFGPLEVPTIPRRWFMLRVFPNRETYVMRKFEQRNISAYLPVLTSIEDVTIYRRGYEYRSRRKITSPMIKGVLLMPDFEVDAGRWREIDCVIGIYHHANEYRPFLTPQWFDDLRTIEAIGNTPKSKRGHKFEIGELVRVTTGPFAHFCAKVERFDSKGRLSVGVDIFGRITPIEIDASDIEKV